MPTVARRSVGPCNLKTCPFQEITAVQTGRIEEEGGQRWTVWSEHVFFTHRFYKKIVQTIINDRLICVMSNNQKDTVMFPKVYCWPRKNTHSQADREVSACFDRSGLWKLEIRTVFPPCFFLVSKHVTMRSVPKTGTGVDVGFCHSCHSVKMLQKHLGLLESSRGPPHHVQTDTCLVSIHTHRWGPFVLNDFSNLTNSLSPTPQL